MLRPEELVEKVKKQIGEDLLHYQVRSQVDGHRKRYEHQQLFIKVERRSFYQLISSFNSISPLHISCPFPSVEKEETIELIYPFVMYYAKGKMAELPVLISVDIPKDDLCIPSLTQIIPGIMVMEREVREMLGIEVTNLPDQRRFFTGDYLQEGYLPLRAETGSVK